VFYHIVAEGDLTPDEFAALHNAMRPIIERRKMRFCGVHKTEQQPPRKFDRKALYKALVKNKVLFDN
jgi:hypothetical protein